MGCGASRGGAETVVAREPQAKDENVKTGQSSQVKSAEAAPEKTPASAAPPTAKPTPKPVAGPGSEKVAPEKAPESKQPPAPAAPKPAEQPKQKTAEELMLEEEAKLFGVSIEEAKRINEQRGKEKLAEQRAKGRTADIPYCVTCHPHPLYLVDQDNGWACNGMMLPEKCASGITDFYQTSGMKHYTCRLDDFDLCEGCINKYAKK